MYFFRLFFILSFFAYLSRFHIRWRLRFLAFHKTSLQLLTFVRTLHGNLTSRQTQMTTLTSSLRSAITLSKEIQPRTLSSVRVTMLIFLLLVAGKLTVESRRSKHVDYSADRLSTLKPYTMDRPNTSVRGRRGQSVRAQSQSCDSAVSHQWRSSGFKLMLDSSPGPSGKQTFGWPGAGRFLSAIML